MQTDNVKYDQFTTAIMDFMLDTNGIVAVIAQTVGNVNVSAAQQNKLYDEAKAVIGTCPVFDMALGMLSCAEGARKED